MAQVSSDNCTKHKHIKPVAVAHDREVLSFSTRNNNNKRKIGWCMKEYEYNDVLQDNHNYCVRVHFMTFVHQQYIGRPCVQFD